MTTDKTTGGVVAEDGETRPAVIDEALWELDRVGMGGEMLSRYSSQTSDDRRCNASSSVASQSVAFRILISVTCAAPAGAVSLKPNGQCARSSHALPS